MGAKALLRPVERFQASGSGRHLESQSHALTTPLGRPALLFKQWETVYRERYWQLDKPCAAEMMSWSPACPADQSVR
jgi:hypothetical protein